MGEIYTRNAFVVLGAVRDYNRPELRKGDSMPVRSLRNDTDRELLLERLRRVPRDAKPLWGSLDAPRMLCHTADVMRIALGELPSKPAHSVLSRTIGKFMVVNTGLQAPRGKIETAPEMMTSVPKSWDADLAACVELVERVGRGSPRAVHPAFGPLSPDEWGRMCWKHLNHHLVQFGA